MHGAACCSKMWVNDATIAEMQLLWRAECFQHNPTLCSQDWHLPMHVCAQRTPAQQCHEYQRHNKEHDSTHGGAMSYRHGQPNARHTEMSLHAPAA